MGEEQVRGHPDGHTALRWVPVAQGFGDVQGAARAVHFQRELLPVIHHRWIPLHTRATNGLVTRIDYADSTYETFTYNSFQQVTTNRLRNGGLLYYGYATNPCTSPPASAPCPPGSTAC